MYKLLSCIFLFHITSLGNLTGLKLKCSPDRPSSTTLSSVTGAQGSKWLTSSSLCSYDATNFPEALLPDPLCQDR